jgi:hypothetical protein
MLPSSLVSQLSFVHEIDNFRAKVKNRVVTTFAVRVEGNRKPASPQVAAGLMQRCLAKVAAFDPEQSELVESKNRYPM